MWVMKWSELLTIKSSNRVSYKSMLLYYNWLQERVANNMPMDQLVRELLSSKGGTFANAATNYFQNETDTLKVAENVAQVFMGMRIQCAQCHNHPFDRWTMDDYYSFAAFFSQIGRKRGEDPRETIVFNSRSGEVRHLVDKRVMPPKFLGGEAPDTKGKDRREIMANWLASTDNPFFAKNLSNLVWAHFFGQGIINDVDDVRVSNPAVNPELLEALASKFTEYNYDFKKLVRDICVSRTYQLSTKTNETNVTDTKNFSHGSLRRLRSEVLLDTISQVTQTKNKFRGLPLGARAVQIADGNTSTYFLSAFGRASRETVCSCEVKMEPNLSQALHLLNGQTLQSKISAGGLIDNWLKEMKKPEEIIDELYIRCFTRMPTSEEKGKLVEVVNAASDKKQILEDVFWALLNSREFLFNS
jgi:mono/diheme cytochrome c family protein